MSYCNAGPSIKEFEEGGASRYHSQSSEVAASEPGECMHSKSSSLLSASGRMEGTGAPLAKYSSTLADPSSLIISKSKECPDPRDLMLDQDD